MSLKLGKLPDRTPVRLNLSVDPKLASKLNDYAKIYRQTYGTEERPEVLIPAMLETFLGADAGFKRARRALYANKGD
nr:DUF2274 domain-containing protein [Hyphomonas sp. Mor2]